MQHAMKDIENKPRYSLLVEEFISDMITVREKGAAKYADWDWMNGRNWTDYTDAMRRHMKAFLDGESLDQESGVHHMAHIAVNAMFLHWFNHVGNAGTDNRPGVLANRILAQMRAEEAEHKAQSHGICGDMTPETIKEDKVYLERWFQ